MGGERQSNEFPTELPSTLEVARAFDALLVNGKKLSREERIQALWVAYRSPQLLKALRSVEARRFPRPKGNPLDRLHRIRIRGQLRNLIAPAPPSPSSLTQRGEWFRADWYTAATGGVLGADRLRVAAQRDGSTIRGTKRGGRWVYEFASVCRAHPECRADLESEQKRTEANKSETRS